MTLLFFIIAVIFYTLSQKRVFAESDDWKNKYKQPLQPAPKNWYYKLSGLKYRERFPLSGTLLVSLTDRYHAYQLGFKVFICLTIGINTVVINTLIDSAILFVIFGVVFTVTYRFVNPDKDK